MSFTSNFERQGWKIVTVNGRKADPVIQALRVPPAWTEVMVSTDPKTHCLVVGKDAAGRQQRLYSPEWIAQAKDAKFGRVRALLAEYGDVRTQIESDLNDQRVRGRDREAALVTYLILETGMRPGSNADTLAAVKAYGATTLQCRHVTICTRGVRLKFTGKKGVAQNVLVTNPYLVELLAERKRASPSPRGSVFRVSAAKVNAYVSELGSGGYTAKDLRTALGTKIALELLGGRKRYPKAKATRKRVVNRALDQVARRLGNTRAVSRSSYVDPEVLGTWLN